jgi:hypothetical protein
MTVVEVCLQAQQQYIPMIRQLIIPVKPQRKKEAKHKRARDGRQERAEEIA